MQPRVHRPEETDEYYFQEGCHILESWNSPDDPQASIARARVAPGAVTHWHRLDGITERYLILSGHGRVELDDSSPQDVAAGAVVIIPPGCRQRIENTGDGDLIFLAICTPRFQGANYSDDENG